MQRYGHVYEHSPWIARRVYAATDGQVDSCDALDQEFRAVISAAPDDQQLELLRAHPELACAERSALTGASRSEQAGAGLDRCSPAEFEAFQELNRAYRERFGFPFILAVAGRERSEILDIFRNRIGNSPANERVEALEQVMRIGRLRLTEAWNDASR